MHVSFERSGGFAGIPMSLSMDSATLACNDAAHLRQLVDNADFFNLPETIPTPAQPDRFQYKITVQEHDRSHTVTVGESGVPTTLKPLVNWLMESVRRR